MRRWLTIGDFECDSLKEEDFESSETKNEEKFHDILKERSCSDSKSSSNGLMTSSESKNICRNKVDKVNSIVDDGNKIGDLKKQSKIEITLKSDLKSHISEIDHSSCNNNSENQNGEQKENNKTISENVNKKVDESNSSNSDCGDDSESTVIGDSSDSEAKKKPFGKWRALEKLTKPFKKQEVKRENKNVSDSDAEKSNEEEDMDAELPRPEHITSFYDLVRAVKNSNENLSAQEIEGKFKQISLAFKTDRITLKQRLEVQQRQRDIAEANFERELVQLKSSILALHEDCIDMELVEAIMQVRKHLDVLTISSTSLLSASEVWGAVQQEWRVSRALEVLLLHVENVKRLYENDHQELEEMRRILNEHQIEYPATGGTSGAGQSSSGDSTLGSIRIRALSLAGVSNKTQEGGGSRRISLGPGTSKTVLKDFLGGRNSRRRASLMPDLRPFHQDFAAVAAAAAAAANSSNSSHLSKERLEEKRHSTNGMLGSSITEEGSESGDETAANARSTTGDSSPTASSVTKLSHFPLDVYGSGIQDPDQRSNEDGTSSSVMPSVTDSHVSSSPASSLSYQSQHWVMHGFEDFIGWLRGGRWPFSSQQTYRGVRYFFTTFLLILAAFFLLLTISSGNEVQQPCHPGWTTIHHVLHPYVTIRHMGGQF